MRAVVYARVSTKEQAANLSLPTQIEACRAYCAQHGFAVARVFVEEGESAKTADRTEFQRMLAYCREQKGRVHYLIVYALNRFARDQFDHYAVRAHLHKLGVTLRSVTEPIDESATGKLMEGILASFAQFDNDVRSERTTAGMLQALRRGQWTFQPPLGYLRAYAGDGPTLAPDPDRAPLIQQAFQAVARGATAAAAYDAAVRAGLTTLRGLRVSRQTFTRLLANPLYYGRIVVARWHIDTPGNFPPLIKRDVFLDAQLVLSGRAHAAKTHQRSRADFPLRGFVRCAECGIPLTASWSRGKTGQRYAYYRCRRGCQSASKATLERAWLGHLERLRPTAAYLKVFEATVLATWADATREAETRRGILEQRVTKLQKQRARLLEVYVYEQGIEKATFERESLKTSEALTLAELELRDARVDELDVEGLLVFARDLAQHAGKLWTEADYQARLTLQACLFPDGVRYRDGTIWNPTKSPIFSDFATAHTPDAHVASPMGFEPLQTPIDRWFAAKAEAGG